METAFRSDQSFTQREFRAWLDRRPSSDINHYELLDGRIIMTPPAGFPHSAVAVKIVVALTRHAQAVGGGLVQESSAGFEFPSGDTLEPDVTFISAARFAAGPRPKLGGFLRIVPDLVVEVLSPSTARRDRIDKKKAYAQCGVDEYWLVDPRRREVTIFAREGDLFGVAQVFRCGPIVSRIAPQLELTVEELFVDLD